MLKSHVPLIQGWQIFIANYQSDTTVHCQELRLAHDEVATHSQCARAQKKKEMMECKSPTPSTNQLIGMFYYTISNIPKDSNDHTNEECIHN